MGGGLEIVGIYKPPSAISRPNIWPNIDSIQCVRIPHICRHALTMISTFACNPQSYILIHTKFDGLPFLITFISMSSMHVVNKYFKMDNHKCRWIRKRVSAETFGIDTSFLQEAETEKFNIHFNLMNLNALVEFCRLWLLLEHLVEREMKIWKLIFDRIQFAIDIRRM